ncbi:MAG: hypothetical protein IT426_17615 [Pirellulales bacterium]|nr:hypothetical protein [Pirellulales bacterium]
MSEIPAPQKPIPQFTIRWMLGLMTGWAMVFSIVALAMRGHLWALGIVVGLGTLVVFMLIGALLFSVVWIFAGFGGSRAAKPSLGETPFAEVIRPKTPDLFDEGE